MTTSGPEIPTRTTGAHRAHREVRDRGAARALAHRPSTCHEPYLDGLFTYCLSVLCDHDAATAALADVLTLAERRGRHVPEAPGDRRAWLYALARWACLRKLAEARQKRQVTPAAGRTGRQGPARTAAPAGPAVSEEVREQRRRELALLAWPEAAGTTPEQREALELAVRHRLGAHEVAAVLGMQPDTARELLASAACEVERTRAALAVVETGACRGVAHLTGDDRLVLSSALRRELVRHVDDCPHCRRTAGRAIPGRWPGNCVTPDVLPVLPAPEAALRTALAHHPRARRGAPRFDRRGFPMDPKDRVARRDRLRARAVTTTVVATVVAAPVLALYAAYRGTPAGEGRDGRSASARQDDSTVGLDGPGGYENTGNAGTRPEGPFGRDGESGRNGESDRADVSVEVVGVAGAGHGGASVLGVTAGHSGDTTLITLAARGAAPVRWSASTGAPWLYLSQSSGTLRAGQSLTVRVHVDRLREPSGRWSARVAVSPAGAVVAIDGHGHGDAPGPSFPDAPLPGHSEGPGRPGSTGSPGTAHPAPPGSPPPSPGDPAGPPPSSPSPAPTPPPRPEPAPSDPPPSPGPVPAEPPPGGLAALARPADTTPPPTEDDDEDDDASGDRGGDDDPSPSAW
ncbi:BACON domain-containing protein [Streptomyces sp. QTS137]